MAITIISLFVCSSNFFLFFFVCKNRMDIKENGALVVVVVFSVKVIANFELL